MTNLVIPHKVVVRLSDSQGNPIPLANVLLRIHLHARHENDFFLQPFATDANGIAVISRDDMIAEVAAHYNSGLMDYSAVESCKPDVEIEIIEAWKIERALISRTTVWKALFEGESQRWKNLDELCDLYRNATNRGVCGGSITARFDDPTSDLDFTIVTKFR